MGKEIEKKFLLRDESWRQEATPGISYRQGYLCIEVLRSVRIRIAGAEAFITIKGESHGDERAEFEYPIPVADAEDMQATLCIKPLIEKKRYTTKHHNLKWEIDEFEGENRGLVVAEVELKDEQTELDLPKWVGKEVTSDPRYFNVNLVKNPYSRWSGESA